MKLTRIIPRPTHSPTVIRFGQAKLVKLSPGRYELIGGSEADQTMALEWALFFGHEIIVHQPANPPSP